MSSPDILDKIRQSTERVTEQAELVKLDKTKLQEIAERHNPADIRRGYNFEAAYHLTNADDELLANYVFTLDALNFGSGLSPQWKQLETAKLVQNSLYKTVADTLRREALGGNRLDASWAADLTATKIGEVFGIPADFPLLAMFANCLNELGQRTLNDYAGRYTNIIEANPTAPQLVSWLGSLQYFDDQASYKEQLVYFYKRAQILVNDLYLAFRGQSFGAFPDVSRLTLFADNLLPHYFRMEGALSYAPELLEQILREEPIAAGSPAEIEMRASAIQCVEILCEIYNKSEPAEAPIFPAQLDNYLWNYAQSPVVKSQPRHRTITYFY